MIFNSGSVSLFYEKSGSGKPLILLHGNGEDHHIFDKSVEILRDYFTVYAIDTRGHGKSMKVAEFHYYDMADDIYKFIKGLEISEPVVYGFSDGGIVGLMLAIRYPHLLSRLIISGANIRPSGVKLRWLILFRLMYIFGRSPLVRLMLNEPDITEEMLFKIMIPVDVTAGGNDIIRERHTREIAGCIADSTLRIFDNETHGSYIVNSRKIGEYIKEACGMK